MTEYESINLQLTLYTMISPIPKIFLYFNFNSIIYIGDDMEYSIIKEIKPTKLESKSLEETFVPFLIENNFTISTAESLTAGIISGTIANVPGSSNVLELGLVTYTEEYKNKALNVSRETLSKYSAVSYETCNEMLDGLSETTNSQLLIAATGYAGPGENAGLVYLGVQFKKTRKIFKLELKGKRNEIRKKVVNLSFNHARNIIEGKEGYRLHVNKIYTL